MKSKTILKVTGNLLFLCLVGLVIYGIFNTRKVMDYVILHNYNPPQRVVETANNAEMTNKTRRVFYVNKPSFQEKADFKNSCPRAEQTIVLGCFVSNKGIFILNVHDQRLSGVTEVTAAHEVLHAMYDRLSSSEKAKVDAMTAKAFSQLDNQRVRDNVEAYRKSDPSVVPNELHSILGSEIRNLPPDLEDYYKQYFTNRAKIVDISEKYEKTFTDIESQTKTLEADLTSLKKELDDNEASLNSLSGKIEQQKSRLDTLLKSNQVEQYNNGVPEFNAMISQYNSLVEVRKSDVALYNSKVEQINSLVTAESNLYNELKVDATPIKESQ